MQFIQFWFAGDMPLHIKNSIESLHRFITPFNEHILITDRQISLVGNYTYKHIKDVLSPADYALYLKCLAWDLPAMGSDLIKYSLLMNCKTKTVQLDADIFFLRDPTKLFEFDNTVVFNHHAEITPAAIMAVPNCFYVKSLYRKSVSTLSKDIKPHHLSIGPTLATSEYFVHIDNLILHKSPTLFKYNYFEYVKRIGLGAFKEIDLINLLLDVNVIGTHLFKHFESKRTEQPVLDQWSELLKKYTFKD